MIATFSPITVSAFYHFSPIKDIEGLQQALLTALKKYDIRGTILVAHEGINGTVAGSSEGIMALHEWLRSDARFVGLVTKESTCDEMPFHRTKVRLKKEIVSLGVEGIDPTVQAGTYIKPKDWNALLDDPDVVLIDTRNDYEVQIGTFEGAVNPNTVSFREFPHFADEYLAQLKDKKIAMFCTGGIRCEKSTSYLTQKGFGQVYHLEGGILKYLEDIPEAESKWQGECFVFDGRVAVNHNIEQGQYQQCFACRMPLSAQEMQSESYKHGISCPHCIAKHTAAQKKRHSERQRQMARAEELGICHVGGKR